ncbi:conserved oligomeric Golgi complex subunit 1 [Trichonephila clavata]|uniref:Conserved oligomeric Golgi complex subunit 1 n=1 Tax=Trichonephila clavata TaxID=2740835 RepID=A0A8X6GLZ5_TRICU|nr:conserved oligomeric Golgi complex subunit 1 [Trichonephila clavata]
MGTDILFENHSVKEIQEIEKKLRNDIERKKEELRQMVGERYRDLMEAADTITEMKEIAESVTSCLKSIEDTSVNLQHSSLQNGILCAIQEKVERKKKRNELLYIVASQIKILMDSPIKIWSYIESKEFVFALSLFLLARHTHSMLLLDPMYRERNVATMFPIINRQWTSISHFKHLLLQNCHTVLTIQGSEPEDVAGPLCCRCILLNSSLQQIFLEILDVRKDVLTSIFRPEKSAKEQICEFVTVVQSTFKMIHVLLFPEDQNESKNGYRTNVLYKEILNLISKEKPGPVSLLDFQSSPTFKFLPSSITDFRPSLTLTLEPCDAEFLQPKCKDWLNYIQESFQTELRSLLNYVSSVQSLALIREAVFDKLCEVENWDKICNDLLNQSFSIWDSFLKNCFWERIETIVNEQVKSAIEFCEKDVEETLYKIGLETGNSEMEIEKNISLYVWKESPNDVMDNIAWHPRHHRNFWNSGELSLKAMGFTPKIQSICKNLDDQLESVVKDISYFSCSQNHLIEESSLKDRTHLNQKLAKELSKDASGIYKYLTQAVETYMFDSSSYIETNLLYLEKEKDTYENSCRIVFLGHLCYGIGNLCPHINCTLSIETLTKYFERYVKPTSKITFSATSLKENELWKDLKKKLLELSASAFRLWSKHQIQHVLNNINSELVTISAEGVLKAILRWDTVEIQEESEQGNAVNSVLRIPQHISTPVANSLFAFCCKLNAIGGYAMSSDVRSFISKELLIGLLDIYKQKIDASNEGFNSRLLQVQSLQLLFDVQFLVGLLVHKGNTCDIITSSSQHIINTAISHIDPFDMDVFSVPLQQNIKKALQKSLSLFGLLASPDQVSYLNSIKSPLMSGQMDHNIMLTCNTGSRFPLLPLSSKSSAVTINEVPEQFSAQPQELDGKNMSSHNSSPNLGAPDVQTNTLKSAASFYDRVTAMSSSWFGN